MNSYERIVAALTGRQPDRTPIMLHNFMLAAKEAGYSMEKYRNNPEVIAQANIHAIEKYSYDGILVDIDTVTLAGACGVNVDFPKEEPARSNKGILDSYDKLCELKPINVANYKYVQIWCESVRILKEHFKNDVFIRGNCDQLPFSLATMIRGTENFMLDLFVESEENIFALLDYCYEATSQFIRLMVEAGADMVSNGDSPAGPSMISPELYEKYAWPYEKKIADYAHQLGSTYTLHICGNTDLILDKMIATGADGLELDYKTDVRRAEFLMRGKSTFLGNIDPSGVIALGTPDLVRKKTLELLDTFSGNPRFILNAGCAIPPITPPENLEMFIRTAREYQSS